MKYILLQCQYHEVYFINGNELSADCIKKLKAAKLSVIKSEARTLLPRVTENTSHRL
jgi:hypothetical protein